MINAQKQNGSAMQTITSKEKLLRKIYLHRSIIMMDGNKEASTFKERCQELEEKIKQKAAAAKSDLKLYEDKKNSGTTEAEAVIETR